MDLIEQSRNSFSEGNHSVSTEMPYGKKEHKNDEMFFVYNILETRAIHKTRTVHLTLHFRLSNLTILHHRVQVWWTIQDLL